METKKRYKSKSYIFNIASILGLAITALLADPKFLAEIDSRLYIALMVGGAFINQIIREFTYVPLDGRGPKPEVTNKPKLNPIDAALKEEADDMGMF